MKKYTSSTQIEKDIDSALRKVAKAKATAQEHLDMEDLLKGADNASELREHREAADKQFRKIKRLESVRLVKLKNALAEFNTGALPFAEPCSGPDSSSRPASPYPSPAID